MHAEITHDVEQFLYREARLLDERRFREWLALLTDDLRYWMAGRSNPYPQVSKALVILEPDRYSETDMPRDDELAIFDETKATLVQRIERLETGMAWAEDPPSRTRHLLSNIEVEPGDMALELKVFANFLGGCPRINASSRLIASEGYVHANGVYFPLILGLFRRVTVSSLAIVVLNQTLWTHRVPSCQLRP